MVIKQTQKVPETTREITVGVSCELCKLMDKKARACGEEISWGSQDNYDVVKTQISLEEGTVYPDGGNLKTLTIQICPKCFKEVLLPFLSSKGVVMQTIERDW